MHSILTLLSVTVVTHLVSVSGALAEGANVLVTSASGNFRVERENVSDEETPVDASGDREWVVSVSDPAKRALLPKRNGDQLYDLTFSPDGKWLAANVHYGSRIAGFRIFRQKEGALFELIVDELPARKWLDASEDDLPIVADMYRHAGWSYDSARLLLRSPVGGEQIKKGKPTAECFYYYNTRIGRVELTSYLRNLNRNAVRILRSDNPERSIIEAQTAEPVEPPPSERDSQARYESSDAKLSKVYAELMGNLTSEEQAQLRNKQRGWIALRDTGANVFAAVRAKAQRPAYQRLYLADATDSRVRELEELLRRTNK